MVEAIQQKSETAIVKNAVKRAITDEERAKRMKAIEYARASVELEGFILDEKDLEHARRYIDGEISLDEFVARRI